MKILAKLLMLVSLVSCTSIPSGQSGAASDDEVRDLSDLSGKRVAVLSGSLQDIELSKLDPSPELLRFASPAETIAAVSKGLADYLLVDTTACICAGMEEKGIRHFFSTDFVSGNYGFAFNKKDVALQREFNSFLSRIKADGRLDEMVTRWTTGDVGKVVMPEIPMDPGGERLVVGTLPTFPFCFIQNGAFAGYEPEILNTFASETGRTLEWQIIDLSGIIAAVTTGKVDIVACQLFITPEREKQVLFSDGYYYCFTSCFGRDKSLAVSKKAFLASVKDSFYDNLVLEDRWKILLDGLWETLVISFFSILFGTLFGGIVCWMRLSRRRWFKGVAMVFVEIVRGIPVLVLLMIMFYVVFSSGAVAARWVAVIAFSINFGAYVSEMFRTGIEGVDRGQTEAGLAMGFSRLKTFVFFIIPQAARKVIPVYKGEVISLIKNTSVVGYIAIVDLTKASEVIRGRTFDAFFPLIVISIVYFILAWLIGKALDCLSAKIA